MNIVLCARCVPDARAWDREYRDARIETLTTFIFCRHCAEIVKRRLEKQGT